MIEMTALAFLLMGAVALVSPHSITRWVAITALPVPARNEVRAVYGGYGVAMAVLLVVCRDHPPSSGSAPAHYIARCRNPDRR